VRAQTTSKPGAENNTPERADWRRGYGRQFRMQHAKKLKTKDFRGRSTEGNHAGVRVGSTGTHESRNQQAETTPAGQDKVGWRGKGVRRREPHARLGYGQLNTESS